MGGMTGMMTTGMMTVGQLFFEYPDMNKNLKASFKTDVLVDDYWDH